MSNKNLENSNLYVEMFFSLCNIKSTHRFPKIKFGSSVDLPSSSIIIGSKSVQVSMSYDCTNKQTEKQRLQLYIYKISTFYC